MARTHLLCSLKDRSKGSEIVELHEIVNSATSNLIMSRRYYISTSSSLIIFLLQSMEW